MFYFKGHHSKVEAWLLTLLWFSCFSQFFSVNSGACSCLFHNSPRECLLEAILIPDCSWLPVEERPSSGTTRWGW